MTLACTILAALSIDLLPMEYAVIAWSGFAAFGGAWKTL